MGGGFQRGRFGGGAEGGREGKMRGEGVGIGRKRGRGEFIVGFQYQEPQMDFDFHFLFSSRNPSFCFGRNSSHGL